MARLRAVLVLVALGCVGPLWAAEDAAPEAGGNGPVTGFTIAVIDPNRVVEDSPQYEQARQMLSAEVAEREAELVDQQESVDRLSTRLERDGALMSEEELKLLQNDIRARNRRLRYAKAELQEDFALRQSELRTKLVKQVEEVVRQIAREKNIDLIVSEGVVYFSDRIDISADVVERLTQEFNKR